MTPRQKQILWLFAWGVFIGFCLEIILLEENIFKYTNLPGTYLSKKRELKAGVTCLILNKHKDVNFLNSSKATWLKHCNDYFVVDIQRHRPTKGKRLNPSKSSSDNRSKFRFNENPIAMCPLKGDDVIKVEGKSGWSAFCKALRMTKTVENGWLVVVPDSVLVLVENLNLFVADLNSDEPHYYGYGIEHYEADFNALSAGILLSRGSLRLLFEKFKTDDDCDLYGKYWRNEDFYLGKYLKEFGITPKDTRDDSGRGRFHGYNLNSLLRPGKLVTQSDYVKKALFPVSRGFNCCSPFLCTMDVASPDAMRKLYFLLYKLVTVHKDLPHLLHPSTPPTFFWKDFLREKGYSEDAIENMTSEEYYKIWEKILPPEVMYNQMRNFLAQDKGQI